MSLKHFRCPAVGALTVALAFGAASVAQAQENEAHDGGPVIQIGPADSAPALPPPENGQSGEPFLRPAEPEHAEQDVTKYWIGLSGGPISPDHPLRAHLEIPASQGLLVASVVPDSPAAKAGLKKHDILLRANDTHLGEMPDLVELVITAGEKNGQIELEVLRRGEREAVFITPEERPAEARMPPGRFHEELGEGEFGLPEGIEFPRDLLRQFRGKVPFEFRQFGPGIVLGDRGPGVGELPSGVSITMRKDAGQPPAITVKRGEETWEIVGDDPEALDQLPAELRPYVERLLRSGSALGPDLRDPGRPPLVAPLPELGEGRLRERLDRMERRLQDLQQRLLDPQNEAEEK